MSDLTDLNQQQREAVRYLDGPLLVLAGAGSGKTRVITCKIAWLVEECGIESRHIAAITFTNKAAREMRERVSGLLAAKSTRGLTICTFHALGLDILRHEARLIGYKPGFSILDAADAQAILADIIKSVDQQSLRRMAGRISGWKNALLDPQSALIGATDEEQMQSARAYLAYQDTLKAYQAMDFDDLIRLPADLFRTHPDVLERWQARLRYLLVDEYQDTNGAQYDMMKALAGTQGRFTAVGDDDQAIYAWRGADIENLRRLTQDWPRLRIIPLEQNYRSSQRILLAANSVIRNNPRLHEKTLWSDLGVGETVEIVRCRDEKHEAESVTLRLSAHKFEHRTKFADYAILYRGNHQARLFEEALRAARIPYQISGGQSFFDRIEIKDLIAYLRLIVNQDDDPAFIRAVTTPKRGVGAATLERLGEYAGKRHVSLFAAVFETGFDLPPRQIDPLTAFCQFINRIAFRAARDPAGELLNELLAAIGYEAWLYDIEDERTAGRKWENVRAFTDWLADKGETEGKGLIALTQAISLMNLLEGRDEADPDAVRLSTLHAAKGLEFGHVFLVGAEEEILPHRECMDGQRLEEERRLMYVGITRARRSLTITWCGKRRRGGESVDAEPSRFLAELDVTAVRHAGQLPAGGAAKAHGRERLALLKAMLDK